jgi:hypothetical protein
MARAYPLLLYVRGVYHLDPTSSTSTLEDSNMLRDPSIAIGHCGGRSVVTGTTRGCPESDKLSSERGFCPEMGVIVLACPCSLISPR